MRFAIFIFVAVLTSAVYAQETNSQKFGSASIKTESVVNVISNYAQRVGSLHELYGDNQSPLRQKIITYYKTATNQIPMEYRIVVAGCMGSEDDFENAAKLLEEYVRVYTNSAVGWMMLGTASGMIDKKERSIAAYEKANALGDDEVVSALVGTALEINRLDTVQKYLTKLIRLKSKTGLPEFAKQDIVGLLAEYAVRVDREDLFIQALEDANVDLLVPRKDVIAVLDKACKKFNSPKLKETCEKISKAVEQTEAK